MVFFFLTPVLICFLKEEVGTGKLYLYSVICISVALVHLATRNSDSVLDFMF